ncbi:MAG: hypothetical protein QOF76_4014 [Solirubrobacteraceae bacterium]|jgi:acyl dehydratase|nr:hypothetical protein [Solirubrobacteraceae bacterium]
MSGLWLDELSEGMTVEHAIRRTLTEADNTLFSVMTMNPQPLHLDAAFSEKTEFGQRLVNSMMTLSTMVGITVYDLTLGTIVAQLGMSDITFPAPMFHGDTLRVETTVKSVRESKSRPGQGIVEFEHTGYNQRDEVVARCTRSALMKAQPS